MNIIKKFLHNSIIHILGFITSTIAWIFLSVGDKYFWDYKLHLIISAIILSAFIIIYIKKINEKLEEILPSAALYFFLVIFIPPIATTNYVGLRLCDKEGYIQDDAFCDVNNPDVIKYKGKGYKVERNYYSWRHAEMLKRYSTDNCEFTYQFMNSILFYFYYTLERVFAYLIAIIICVLLLTTYQFFNSKNKLHYNSKLIKSGLIIVFFILLYNTTYIASLP